jgi:hypothetical protein
MGQDFNFLNLDKKETLGGWGKFGEFFFDGYSVAKLFGMLLNEDPHKNWAGDRIIIVGEYQRRRDVPVSLLEYVDALTIEHGKIEGNEKEFSLYQLKDSFTDAKGGNTWYTDGLVLRNLSKFEYVKADDFGRECINYALPVYDIR